jgi:uncharacterized protein (DUF4415 family)
MKESSTGLKSNLHKVDQHTITPDEYAEIPELPASFFAEGKLYRDGKPVSRRPRGKQKEPVKRQLTLRLSAEVIDLFKATGRGWQARMDSALRDWLKEHKPAA